jgi:hypothetical protein
MRTRKKEIKITRKTAAAEVMRLASCFKYKEALELVRRFKVKNVTVTKLTLKKKYGLNSKEIESLDFIEVDNPHFKSAGNMKLYLRGEAYRLQLKKQRANKENSKLNR